jgi:hypothetical protein
LACSSSTRHGLFSSIQGERAGQGDFIKPPPRSKLALDHGCPSFFVLHTRFFASAPELPADEEDEEAVTKRQEKKRRQQARSEKLYGNRK